jgi:hypothetical protein
MSYSDLAIFTIATQLFFVTITHLFLDSVIHFLDFVVC